MSNHGRFWRLDLAPTISRRRYSSSSLPTSFSIIVLFDLSKFLRGLGNGRLAGGSLRCNGSPFSPVKRYIYFISLRFVDRRL